MFALSELNKAVIEHYIRRYMHYVELRGIDYEGQKLETALLDAYHWLHEEVTRVPNTSYHKVIGLDVRKLGDLKKQNQYQ